MAKVLTLVMLLALQNMVSDSMLLAASQKKEAQKIRQEYYIDTDLSAGKFSEAFCTRLSVKHNWNRISSGVSTDETYTSLFEFKDEASHPWQCEVQISRTGDETGIMHVEMTMTQMLVS